MSDGLRIEFPSQGWKQCASARDEMLASFDVARKQAKSHEVETFHGNVAEAACRKWLAEFLPKKYGVTSGYVVSTGLKSDVKLPHFDVIIYDQMNSPVLWIEGNPDASHQGRSMAIPVEYVRAVLEVKSSFSKATVDKAIGHLKDLDPVMGGLDDSQERYKLYLPRDFCCGVIFYELRLTEKFSEAALESMIGGVELRNFLGGLVLRAEEGKMPGKSGRVSPVVSDTEIKSTVVDKELPLSSWGMCKSRSVSESEHIAVMILWSESKFAEFAFDLIASMEGRYRPGFISSAYGLGNSLLEHME